MCRPPPATWTRPGPQLLAAARRARPPSRVRVPSHSTKPSMKPSEMCWTSSTGTPSGAGQRGRGSPTSTCGPPVEAPIATTRGARGAREARRRAPCGARRGAQRRTTFTSAISFTVRSSSRGRLLVAVGPTARAACRAGSARRPRAPRSAPRVSALLELAVAITIGVGVALHDQPRRLEAVQDSACGRPSGSRRAAAARPARRPPRRRWRRPTTSRPSASSISERRYSRVTAESSAISTRIMRPSTPEPVDDLEQVGLLEARLHDVGVGADLDPALLVLARLERADEHDRQVLQALVGADPLRSARSRSCAACRRRRRRGRSARTSAPSMRRCRRRRP